MKKYVYTFLSLLLCSSVYGQTNTFPSSGNVGIGTTSPSEILEISTGTTTNDAVLKIEADTDNNHENANARIELMQDGGTLGAFIGFDYDWGGTPNEPDNYFRIGTKRSSNYYDRFVINTNNGNIGIGIAHALEKFHIVEGNLFVENNALLFQQRANGTNDGMGIGYDASGNMKLFSDANIFFQESDYDITKIRFDLNNGRIGIGENISLTERLVVDGTILAEEVKVQNVPQSDYVFEPDYHLLPISEVENHIKEKKHLPGIPSAEEFKENGVGLGEMDDMLLRKIEELTLYVIELKKENEALNKELNIIKSQIENE